MKAIESAQKLVICGLVFLLPLFFLPITSDFFNTNKVVLMAVFSLLSFLIWGVIHIRNHNFSWHISPTDLPVVFFGLVFLISAFVATANKMDAFIFPGVVTAVLSSILFYFVILQYIPSTDAEVQRKRISGLVSSWILGVIVASLIILLSGIGLFGILAKPLSWLVVPFFSTVGGILPTFVLFAVTTPLIFGRVMQAIVRAEKSGGLTVSAAVAFLGFVVFVASFAFLTYQALPGKATSFQVLPISAGWSISLETLKKLPFLGVGPGDFSEAFNRFRPLEYNADKNWNLAFSASSNFVLDLFTVSGILGAVTFVFLLLVSWKSVSSVSGGGDVPYLKATFFVFVLSFLVFPAFNVTLFFFFVLISVFAALVSRGLVFHVSMWGDQASTGRQRGFNLMALLVVFASIGSLSLVGFFGGKAYAADVFYRKALNAVSSQGKYKDVMDSMARAIQLNPRVDFYRTDHSQISLALVQEIAKKESLSEADKNDITGLVQLSIAQAKAAVSLNPTKSANWANLGNVYRAIMPIVQGSDQFAISVYQEAIALEPTNPNLRIALGGVWYSLANYDEAIKSFELAVAAKSDLANAHYNLAIALRDASKTERAVLEIREVLKLLDPKSSDYSSAQAELEKLEVQVAKDKGATPSAELKDGGRAQPPLQAPQPAASPVVSPKLPLPSDAAPPAASSSAQQSL